MQASSSSAGQGEVPAVSSSTKVCYSPRGSQASKALALNGIATAQALRQRRFQGIESAGEKLFIDYAGPTLALADGSRTQVFVAAMGASSYTFACATADQSKRSWLGAMAWALTFQCH